MAHGLRQLDALPHAFAIPGDFAARRFRHTHALNGFPGEIFGFSVRATIQAQIGIDELVAGESFGERIELRAVADVAEKLFRIVGPDAEHADVAARWPDQAGHEVHQRGLTGTVGSNQTGDAGRNGKIDAVNAQHVSIEFGDILKHHSIVRAHQRTTSNARTFLAKSARQMPHITSNATQAPATGMSIRASTPKSCAHTRVIRGPGAM